MTGTFPHRISRARLARLALLLPLALAAPGCDAGDEGIAFGVAGPFETPYGASTLRGVQLAQREINAAGGIDGEPLELVVRDDGNDRETAIAVADELYQNPDVVAVIGHVNSGTTIAAAPVYAQGLPAVATSATSPAISRLGEWIFRVASSDSANAVALAREAREMADSVAILYENDDYGRGLAQSFGDAFRAAGGAVVETDPYLPSTEDLRPYLERIRRAGVDLVFIAGLEVGASRLIAQAREVGLDARFLGGDGLEGLVDMGPAYDGTLIGLLYHPQESARAADFAAAYQAAYGRTPDSYAALGYDATMLLADAVRRGGASRRGIRNALAETGREGGVPAFQGAAGTIRFDAQGDPAGKEFAVGVIRDGRIVLSRDD